MPCVPRLVVGFALCAGLLGAVVAAADTAGLELLPAQRQAIADRFEREQATCRQRFAVNACLDAAQARHRQALKDVQARQEAANLQQRKGRAAARQAEIDRKDKLLADRPPAPPDARRVDLRRVDAAALPGQASVVRPTPAPLSNAGADRAAARVKAAERAEAAKRMQAEIRADQARIQERLARRAAQGKKSAPLPEPEARPSRAPAARASAPG